MGVNSVSEYGNTSSFGVPHELSEEQLDGFRHTGSPWGGLPDSSPAVIDKAFGISNGAEGSQISIAIRIISGHISWVQDAMGSLRMRLRVPESLESGLRDTWSPSNRLGELRESQVCCGWGQGIPGAFREFRSPRSEFNSYLVALGNTKSPAGEFSGLLGSIK